MYGFVGWGGYQGGAKGLQAMIERRQFIEPLVLRDAVNRLLPPAKQELDVTSGGKRFHTIINTFDANARWNERREALATARGRLGDRDIFLSY